MDTRHTLILRPPSYAEIITFCCIVFLHIPHISHSHWMHVGFYGLLKGRQWPNMHLTMLATQLQSTHLLKSLIKEAWIATVKKSTMGGPPHMESSLPRDSIHLNLEKSLKSLLSLQILKITL